MVKIVGVMNRIRNIVSSDILLNIYNSLILSHLHYGILCWGFSRNKLFRLQKKPYELQQNKNTMPILNQSVKKLVSYKSLIYFSPTPSFFITSTTTIYYPISFRVSNLLLVKMCITITLSAASQESEPQQPLLNLPITECVLL